MKNTNATYNYGSNDKVENWTKINLYYGPKKNGNLIRCNY